MSQPNDPWLTVLILAGGSLNKKQIGPIPSLNDNPADLADGSGLARGQIYQHFQPLDGVRLCLLSDQSSKPNRPHLCDSCMKTLLIEPQTDVIASLKEALPHIKTPWILLQPITSLPTLIPEPRCTIELGEQPIPRENWSAIADLETSKPRFLSRDQRAKTDEEPSHPFTGVICAPRHLIQASLPKEGSDLLLLAEQIWKTGQAHFRLSPWRDLGHRATYHCSRVSRLNSRSFNQIRYDKQSDLIHKCSNDKQRLQQEYHYLQTLPSRLKRHFPTLVSQDIIDIGQKQCCLELEYIPYPNLAELFLHWKVGANGWRLISQRLANIRQSLLDSDIPTPAPSPVSTSWLYSKKLQQRLALVNKNPPALETKLELSWHNFWANPLQLQLLSPDGSVSTKTHHLPSPEAVSNALLQALPQLEHPQQLLRVHGDFCFNNILVEPLTGSIRLIDPRGEPAPASMWPTGFGDPRYDLVKLLHSSRYLYDVICNSLFHLDYQSSTIQLQLNVPEHYDYVNRTISEDVIKGELTLEEERLLTASLFLSMLPLHHQDPLHCVAFSCIGVLIHEHRFDGVLQAARRN